MPIKLSRLFSRLILVPLLLDLTFSLMGQARETHKGTMPEREQEGPQEVSSGAIRAVDYPLSLPHGGIIRKYNVHLPPGYNKNNPFPLVIHLHGGGGSIRGAYNDGVDKAADKFGFILVVPGGTGPVPDRLLTWNGRISTTWVLSPE